MIRAAIHSARREYKLEEAGSARSPGEDESKDLPSDTIDAMRAQGRANIAPRGGRSRGHGFTSLARALLQLGGSDPSPSTSTIAAGGVGPPPLAR
eukprot:6100982-Prymnesium_polylepis.1